MRGRGLPDRDVNGAGAPGAPAIKLSILICYER